MSDFDGAWKEALDLFFEAFLRFFFPDIHADIDWTVDCESLEQELRQLAPQAEVGRRYADKLVKVARRGEGPAFLHIEAQNQVEADFERRVFQYNNRAEDRYNQPVVSLVVLGDDSPKWRPRAYVFELWGCRKVFKFRNVKLLSYRRRKAQLERDANPFALLVLAHLQTMATRHDPKGRRDWKIRLIKGLDGRELDVEDVRHWYRLLDWLLDLPAELEKQVLQEIARFEEGKRMERLTSFERIGLERGLRKGLRRGIESTLQLKFGDEGLQLMSAIGEEADVKLLETILDAIKPATSLDDIRKLLPAAPPAPNGSP